MTGTTFGATLRRLRDERGYSLRQLGAMATVSRTHLHDVERERKTPSVQLVRVLDNALRADGELTRAFIGPPSTVEPAGESTALRVAFEWLVTDPPQVEHLAAGRRVGAELVEHVVGRTHELRLLDDHLGGADTMALVERELRHTETVVAEASYSERVGRRLLSALAELGQLAGWTASDAGEYDTAERFYLDAVRAAHAAADPLGAGNALSSLAYQQANVGRPTEAVLLARAAVRGTQQAPAGRARALFVERLAWALARVGENRDTDRALEQVDNTMDPRDDDPLWVYWLDRAEVDVMAGRCYVELRRPLRAVPLLTSAIDSYPADRARETGLYLTWLAESYAQANEHDAARGTLTRVWDLAAGVHSERLHSRVRELDGRLA